MKTIGIIGGISWVSTVDYYRYLNTGINEVAGGLNFAQCIIYSFNYAEIKKNNDANDWEATLQLITKASKHLQESGAEAILLAANTMHVIADKLQQQIRIPVIHIADATAEAIQQKQLTKIGLLGTRFTMEMDFFTSRLNAKNIEVLVPEQEERAFIHYTIFEELGRAVFTQETKQRYQQIIQNLVDRGAEGIILGCTEIPLLIQPGDVSVPIFDTAQIHVRAAVAFALQDS